MSLEKLSASGLIALALCLCCAFSLKPKVAQQPISIKIEDYPNAFQNREPVKIIGLYLGRRLSNRARTSTPIRTGFVICG
jgi:hypothetical protein